MQFFVGKGVELRGVAWKLRAVLATEGTQIEQGLSWKICLFERVRFVPAEFCEKSVALGVR